MRSKQLGVTLSGLLMSAVILALVSLLGMKVAPEVIEYYQIVKAIKKVAGEPSAKESVVEAQRAFERQADVDNIKVIKAADLDITKDGGNLVISFAYESRIHLFKNVSLLLEFEGSSSGG